MIESLSQLTMRQYIELACGDTSVLTRAHEVRTPAQLAKRRSRLMREFAALSDEGAHRATLNRHALMVKSVAELNMFQCLANTLALDGVDDVRGVLRKFGISREMDDAAVAAEVAQLLRRAKTNVKRYQSEAKTQGGFEPTPDEVRAQFDRQAVSLMTYFKFQIDLATISASQFACMIDQANKQLKAQMAAMSKR